MFHITTMDINTALVCTAVFFFSAIMVYLISVFGMKERTYEEAIEEQRRRNQEASHHKSDKSKKDKKFKKWGRRSKDKSAEDEKLLGEGSMEQEHILHQHAEFKTEEDSDIEHKTRSKKKSKVLASKTTLLNRDEITQPSSSEETEEDQSQDNIYPKDMQDSDSLKLIGDGEISDIEQLQNEKNNETNEEQEDDKIYKLSDANRMPVKSTDQIKLNEISSHVTPLPSGKSSPNKKKKIKTENTGVNKSDSGGNKLISTIKTASLNDEEIQMMIDILLDKQGNSSEWTKRNDPVVALKKHLQEKEQALETEQRLVQAANAKMKELRQELVQEKSRSSGNERTLRDKVSQQQQEIQNLHNRIQCTHEQHLSERSTLQAKLQQVEQVQSKISEEHTLTVQRLQEEKSQLQQALSRLEADHKRSSLEMTRLQRELEQLLSTRDQYETRQAAMQQAQDNLHHQTQQLEEYIQKLVSNHKEDEFGYKQHLNDMSNKLQQSESSQAALAQELQNIQTMYNTLETESLTLRKRLEEAEHSAGNKTHELQQLQKTLEEAHKKHMELANCCDQLQSELLQMKNKENEQVQEIDDLQKENEKLSSELANTIEQMSEMKKMEMQEKENKIDLAEHKQLLEMKEQMLQELYEQLKNYKSKLNGVHDELENYKTKNNELKENNWKAMEAMTVVEKEAEEKLQESERIASEKIKQIQQESDERIQEIKKEVDKCEQIQKDLAKANEKIVTLQNQVTEADKKVDCISKDANDKILEAQKNADERVEQILREAAEKYNELHQDLEERLKEAKITAKEEVEEVKKIAQERTEDYKNMQESYRNLQLQIEEKIEQAIKSTERQMVQKQKDLELKLQELQKIIDQQTIQVDKLVQDSAVLLKEQEERKIKFLQRLFPDIQVDQLLPHDEWERQFEEKASNILNDYKKVVNKYETVSDSNDNNKISPIESKEYTAKLEAQVNHYKSVLSDTEDILNKLQKSVETEEQVWKEKLKSKDQEFNKMLNEKEQIMKEKLSIETELKESKNIKQKENLSVLQSQIETEKYSLKNEIENAKIETLNLQKELNNKAEELNTLQKEKELIEVTKNELEQMKIQLENEKKISKELSAQIVKLNTLVKTGQEAVKVEQDLVKELQAQLCISRESTANGTSIQSSGEMPVSTNGASNRK